MGKDSSSADKSPFVELVEIMARLRSRTGCPWDRKQDHRSLRPCLLEETYEVLEAIDRGDSKALRQELGDLLLQVVFHAQLTAEAGEFDIDDVVKGLRDKLVARHPHVFGDSSAETPEEVLHQWDDLKRRERGEADDSTSPMTEVPKTLPALSRAQVVERRAARAGRGRAVEDVCASACAALGVLTGQKLDAEESQKVVGELLLAAVELARIAGLDAEQVLRERVNERISELSDRADSPDAPTGAGRD
jgi:tetrapyrrole methylase family protein/MazG family protein